MATTEVLVDPVQLQCLAHPTRRRILELLRAPDSAAGVARALDEPRQRVNHHVRELAKVGLLRSAGERRKGNFVEQLYEAVAETFVVSQAVVWGDDERRRRALADQRSLTDIVRFAERVQSDAAALLDRAVFDGAEIPSASVRATVHLGDADRSAFLDEYVRLVQDLVDRYAAGSGEAFTIGCAIHPTVDPAPEETP